jgi:hypothetical protein
MRSAMCRGNRAPTSWSAFFSRAIPEPDGQADWGVCLEVEGEDFDEGRRTEDEMRESIDEKLAQYADLEGLLANWA